MWVVVVVKWSACQPSNLSSYPAEDDIYSVKLYLKRTKKIKKDYNSLNSWWAVIVPWFHLRLPSCRPRFESGANKLRSLK